jgi:hypothetical protein
MLQVDEDERKRLAEFLDREIGDFFAERGPILHDWKRWQSQYWAEPPEAEKNFPFERAANFVVPLTAIAVEAIASRFINVLFAADPMIKLRAKTREWVDATPKLERFLQSELDNNKALDVWNFVRQAMLEVTKLGTTVGKSGYRKEFRKVLQERERGTQTPLYVETTNGATLEWLTVGRFMMRLHETDPDDAHWCGEEHEFTWSQLKSMAQSGRMDPEAIERIKAQWVQNDMGMEGSGAERGITLHTTHPIEDGSLAHQIAKQANLEPLWHQVFRVKEIWVSWDIDGDGVDEELVVDFHRHTKEFLSIRSNWNRDASRPYGILQFLPIEGQWVGLGVGKQNEQLQEEITTIRRQRIDNATLANMRMFAVRKGSGVKPGEPIFPGKMWFVTDPKNDIAPIQMSEIYASSVANEAAVQRDSDKRTAVNEALLGLPPDGTPPTATSEIQRLQEGSQKFDFILKGIRRWMKKLFKQVLLNYQQFGDQELHFAVMGDREGEVVDTFFSLPPGLVTRGVAIELNIVDARTNTDVERRELLTASNLLTSHYAQVFQLAAQLGDPQLLRAIGQKAIEASDELLGRLMSTFRIPDSDLFKLGPAIVPGGATDVSGAGGGEEAARPALPSTTGPAVPTVEPGTSRGTIEDLGTNPSAGQ